MFGRWVFRFRIAARLAGGRVPEVRRPGPTVRLVVAGVVALAPLMVPVPASATTAGRDGLIAFWRGESDGSSFRSALYTANPDGTSARQLTFPDWGFTDTASSWSPDGTRIAFERDDNALGFSEIYTVYADGSDLQRVTDCVSQRGGTNPQDFCGGYFDPKWTPDGRSIVVTRCCVRLHDFDHQTIDIINADGSGLRQVTFDPSPGGGDDGPAVSPDGRWIAFSRQIGDPISFRMVGSALFVVHPDGSGLRQITSSQLWVDEKDWSPDGSTIAFVTHALTNGTPKPFRADVDTIAPDGSNLRQLTTTTAGQTFAFAPVWAPAGDRIMFNVFPDANGATGIETMRPDGSEVQVVPDGSRDRSPSWGTAPLR